MRGQPSAAMRGQPLYLVFGLIADSRPSDRKGLPLAAMRVHFVRVHSVRSPRRSACPLYLSSTLSVPVPHTHAGQGQRPNSRSATPLA